MHVRSTLNRALLCGAAILFVAACGDTNPQLPTDAESAVEQVQASNGDVATALAVKGRHAPDLMEIEGVVGTGVGLSSDRPVIRVYTVHGNVRGIPDHVENVPIERVVTGLIMAGTTSRARPAPNGFSIGHPDITAGTFGALVQDAEGTCYALSNNHVLANSNDANIGDSALQPGPFDGGADPDDAIGTLADFEPILFDGSNNTIDAAIAKIFRAGDVTGKTPELAEGGYGAPGTGIVSLTQDDIGLDVMKFGRTTELETGDVAEIGVTVDVCYEVRGLFNCVKLARFVNQISISPGSFSGGGDSGSLIVENETGNKNAVGLLFAGSSTRTLANPIADVYNGFDRVGAVNVQTDPSKCTNSGDDGGGDTNSPPTAAFTYTATDLKVDFTDASTDSDGNITSWAWDFGDGATSTVQHPSHTYAADGTYTVTLTVTDDDGADDSASQNVPVSASTSDGFTLSSTGYKVRGLQKADLEWAGATSTDVDVYRNGSLIATTANNGSYTDNIDNRGSGTYTYEVCEADTSTTCSNESTVTF